MKPELQRRVQRYGWDRASEFYENYWKEQLAPAQELTLKMADLQPGERVVDIACGTGLVTIPAAKAVGKTGRVVATDISDRMVEITLDVARATGHDWVTTQQMDAESLELEDDSFDAALCALGLMYVPEPHDAIREMWRVLRPGGRSVSAVWGHRSSCGWAEVFPIVDARVNTDVCPLFFQLGTGESLALTYRNAGFEDVTLERINVDLLYDSADAAIGAIFAGGPVAMAYARFDEATKDEAHAEYLASIAPYQNGKGYRIPGEFVVVRGVRPAL